MKNKFLKKKQNKTKKKQAVTLKKQNPVALGKN